MLRIFKKKRKKVIYPDGASDWAESVNHLIDSQFIDEAHSYSVLYTNQVFGFPVIYSLIERHPAIRRWDDECERRPSDINIGDVYKPRGARGLWAGTAHVKRSNRPASAHPLLTTMSVDAYVDRGKGVLGDSGSGDVRTLFRSRQDAINAVLETFLYEQNLE